MMTQEKKDEKRVDKDEPQPISIESDEREGNNVAALVGSGAPMITVKANVGCLGLSAGDEATFVQTEEVRLNIQNENLSVVAGSAHAAN